jgi:hypothetical protein
MKKITFLLVFAVTLTFALTECFNKAAKVAEKKPEAKLITHQEGTDTLRKDTNAPILPLVFHSMRSKESYEFCQKNDLSSIFKMQYAQNGFFGEDHYRIEFIFTEVKKDSINVNLYHVKGKNRHKGVVSAFEGEFKLIDIASFEDPNLGEDSSDSERKLFAASGDFEFTEAGNSNYSGVFKGKLLTEFEIRRFPATNEENKDVWYYSDNLPSGGAGYRFEGTWTDKKGENTKPFIWAADIFRFANNILKDFSYGEREVEINPKYRNLGWEELWTGDDEWWLNEKDKKNPQ